MEIGLGIHGENGKGRSKILKSREIVEIMM